jgi:serine/threonine protein kinase
MLEVDPEHRLSAADCLTHDFFIENSKNNPSMSEVDDGITDNLRDFQEK